MYRRTSSEKVKVMKAHEVQEISKEHVFFFFFMFSTPLRACCGEFESWEHTAMTGATVVDESRIMNNKANSPARNTLF